tara:strand:- start:4361 stop:5374 length:1014 start_codon:yes stop_codon:yes gene_type:complete
LEITLGEIASKIGGKVIGDSNHLIKGVSQIQDASPGTITFLSNPAYKKYLETTNADAVIVEEKIFLNEKRGIVVQNSQFAMAKTLRLFNPVLKENPIIHSMAYVSDYAKIGKKVSIAPGACIEKGVKIGDGCKVGSNTFIGADTILGNNCELKANVSVYNNSNIGSNVIIHSGTTIGSDGFGFVTVDGIHEKIPQTGNAVLENDVEIGSNCSVDRGTIGSTVIGEMTKIDNLVHIAHNVKIGKGCLITAGFAVAGSTEIGDFCTFAGQVGIAPHLKIGNNSVVASKSGVTKSLKGDRIYAGFPARDIKDHNRRQALISEIYKLKRKVSQLSEEIKDS